MKIGYARVSKAGGSQVLDLQVDALIGAGVEEENIYKDEVSGKKGDRPGLASCLKALRKGDVLTIWKLDRLGRNLQHLVNVVQDLADRGVGLKVLTGQGADIDTTTATGKMVFGIFAALAEYERELIRERTIAGFEAARARGRKGGRRFSMTKAKIRLAQVSMKEEGGVSCLTCFFGNFIERIKIETLKVRVLHPFQKLCLNETALKCTNEPDDPSKPFST